MDFPLLNIPPPLTDADGIARWPNGTWYNHGGYSQSVGGDGWCCPTGDARVALDWLRRNAG